jgi:hypothetical protein
VDLNFSAIIANNTQKNEELKSRQTISAGSAELWFELQKLSMDAQNIASMDMIIFIKSLYIIKPYIPMQNIKRLINIVNIFQSTHISLMSNTARRSEIKQVFETL